MQLKEWEYLFGYFKRDADTNVPVQVDTLEHTINPATPQKRRRKTLEPPLDEAE